MIRVDAAWLAIEPLDIRAGADKPLVRVVNVFGEARAHHAYLFVNKRANRMKVLMRDGFGSYGELPINYLPPPVQISVKGEFASSQHFVFPQDKAWQWLTKWRWQIR